jgi:hypothetical protein
MWSGDRLKASSLSLSSLPFPSLLYSSDNNDNNKNVRKSRENQEKHLSKNTPKTLEHWWTGQ